jgi:hypothetical protein
MCRSLRAGLPPQRLPLPGFLTLSAVSSRHTLVAVFQATSTPRLHGPSELLPPRSAVVPFGTRCSPVIGRSETEPDKPARLDASTHPLGRAEQTCATHHRRPWLQSFAPTGRPTLHATGERHAEPLLSWPFPLRGIPTRPLGVSPPLVHLATCHLRRGARRRCFRVSIRSGLGAAPEGAASASMRFVTSYASCRSGLRRVTPGRLGSKHTANPASKAPRGAVSPVSMRFRC